MKRIVLDLSTSHIWRRPAVGIIRTEHRFASFLLGLTDKNILFCRYCKDTTKWIVVEHHAAKSYLALQDPVNTQTEEFHFTSNDVYISMGLDWEHNNLSLLYGYKEKIGFKIILFCYDTIPILFPDMTTSAYYKQLFGLYFSNVCHTADHVIAISESSKRDFIKFSQELNFPCPPVSVIYLGTEISESMPVPIGSLEKSSFVLMVSTIEARKNHKILCDIWESLSADITLGKLPKLVFVGMIGWGVTELIQRIQSSDVLRAHVKILDNVTDAELKWLYQNCLFTVFSSYYEGWGLPVAESLAMGKLCISSNTSSLPEVTQNLAPMIDPNDFSEWEETVKRYILNFDLLEKEEKKIKKTYKINYWANHGKKLVEIACSL